MLKIDSLKNMNNLPDHKKLCQELLTFFQGQDGITAAFIGGSGASGGMDFYSDLDLGFLCDNQEIREKVWSKRFDWALPPWFHRMDADHIKPHFIIYLFEPHIHVDFLFYTTQDLPTQEAGPFTVAFDKENTLEKWIIDVNQSIEFKADWSNVIHEEERFWTWTHYFWCHAGRGESYDCAANFELLRSIPQLWHARLEGTGVFTTRRLEDRGQAEFIERMHASFPMPDRTSVKVALLNLIQIHIQQREIIDELLEPQWKTTEQARDKITRMIKGMI